jgi:Spy/CpxP family protein refolding chaperone
MRLLASFAVLLALGGCASDPQSGMPGRDGDFRGRRPDASRGGEGRDATSLSALPPGNWWRSDRFSAALNLTDAQKARLDELDASSAPSLADYRRIAEQAQRDLATLLDSDHPPSADILIAGSRIRDARDKAFDAEIRHVADVRDTLSHGQWLALEAQMRALRDQTRDSGQGRGRRGGMGGMGGGRRPF